MCDYRLPNDIKPIKYRIRIEPIGPDYHYFRGVCYIIFTNSTNTNTIILNGYDIKIKSIYLVDNVKKYDHRITSYDTERQQIKLFFDTVPKFGMIVIKYIGKINDECNGLFRTKENNEWIFYTQFEPVGARRCFPCFDEPIFKAKFNMELLVPDNKLVLSNSNIKSKTKINDKILYIFNETLPMSTYIVAFYIGNLKKKKGITADGIPVRIFGNQSEKELDDILVNTIKCMDRMTYYIGIQSFGCYSNEQRECRIQSDRCYSNEHSKCRIHYAMPKLDLVFVPDFDALGMENWGLIFIRNVPQAEKYLLYKINLTSTIFHELAHQWFGNMVTIDWWSEIWLNESFATWFGWFIMNDLHPEWKPIEQFYLLDTFKALNMDCLNSTHPIKTNIEYPNDIIKIFDAISYSKGATIINMLVNYVGIDTFMEIIKFYIKKFYLKNANTQDFIDCAEFISNKPINNFIKNWIEKKNYPIVHVNLQNDNALYLEQDIFIRGNKKSNQDILWNVPLSMMHKHYQKGVDIVKPIIFNSKTALINIEIVDNKFNKDAFGFYLINYNPKIIYYILTRKFSMMSNLDIAEMMNNLFMTMESGELSFDLYLGFLKIIINNLLDTKPSGLLAEIIERIFYHFATVVINQNMVDLYGTILSDYVNGIMDKIGLEFKDNDNIDIIVCRIKCFDLACYLGIKKYIQYLNDLFNKYRGEKNIEFVPYYIRNTVVRNAIINENKNKNFDFLLKQLVQQKNAQLIIPNITLTNDLNNYYKSLNLIFMDELNNNNKIEILVSAGSNKKFNKYLWQFIKNHWKSIYEIFIETDFPNSIASIFKYMVDHDNNLIENIKLFFINNDNVKNFEESLILAIEYIEINTFFNKLLI